MDEIFAMGHEQVIVCHDAAAGYRAIIALHSTILGPAVGGTRLWPYATTADALRDALRLSRGMTYKNAMAGLAMGGGKAVIIADGATVDRDKLFRAHGRFIERLKGQFITAEDVGTTPADFAIAATETKHVAGFDGRGGDPSPWTALGVMRGILACANLRWGRDDVAGRTIAVQGCGNVGGRVARALAAAGARLILADANAQRAQQLAEEIGATVVAPDRIHQGTADILCPCALGATLNDETIPQLQVSIVAGAANNQLQDARHAQALADRGILYAPDFVINAGGVISGSVTLLGESQDEMERRVAGIYETLGQVFARAHAKGITTTLAAEQMAEAILATATSARQPSAL